MSLIFCKNCKAIVDTDFFEDCPICDCNPFTGVHPGFEYEEAQGYTDNPGALENKDD